jgi:hypothetical protein
MVLAKMAGVYAFAAERPLNLEAHRARLRKMDDEALKRHGEAAAFLCAPAANHGKPPRETFVIQLEEARAEWKRRREGKAGF